MNFKKSSLSFEDENIGDNDITKDFPTLADLMREQNISSEGKISVHYRRDLDSLD